MSWRPTPWLAVLPAPRSPLPAPRSTPSTSRILPAATLCWNRSPRSGRPSNLSTPSSTACLADGAILATNTSTIPIARLAAGQADRADSADCISATPSGLRPLVEVIPGPATSPETVAAVVAHARSLGKLPLIVADRPGFVVNRLLQAYLNEALALVTAGLMIQHIDAAMVEFGMPLGPLELLDEIGLDTALQSGVVLAETLGERSQGSELLLRLVKAGQYGRKAGAGFYAYPGKKPNPSYEVITMNLRGADILLGAESASRAAIAERLLVAMTAEAGRVLQEEQVSTWQVDLAVIFGLGFPLWRGGLLWWADHSPRLFTNL